MSEEDLLPCPFCGEQPKVIEETPEGDCQVFCTCEAEPCVMRDAGHLEEAKKAWNTRKIPPLRMEVKSPLDERKPCSMPMCDGQMQYLFGYIQHEGFGHPGPAIAWICMKCKHQEPLEPFEPIKGFKFIIPETKEEVK